MTKWKLAGTWRQEIRIQARGRKQQFGFGFRGEKKVLELINGGTL